MPKIKLHEVVLPTDRWSARVVSPIDITRSIDTTANGKVVMVHPGWGKAPERHHDFLLQLADEGFLPIGVDTRYAYGDRQAPRSNKLLQPRRVSTANPYFPVTTRAENRWLYRRPTVLLDVCERLGIGSRSYVGHSKGGMISAFAASAEPNVTDKLVIVNGAGMGDSSNGASRLLRSNVNNLQHMAANRLNLSVAVKSALGSVAFTASHPRRVWAEKGVMQHVNTWTEAIDPLECTNVAVTVMHAEEDELIAYSECKREAASRPFVEFVPTPGGHSNVYEQGVRDLIIRALQSN